jgi:anti-sigma regulatory factor (Ser/Thr protein kinase)
MTATSTAAGHLLRLLPLGSGAMAPSTVTYALRPRPESVKAARDFTRVTLQGWGLVAVIDDLSLVVSELVSNAVRHAFASRSGDRPAPPDSTLQLSLVRDRPYLMCAVTDPGDGVPVRRQPDYIAETGRGLQLVESFSQAWGWSPLSTHGKVVWALFHLAG